MGSHPEPYRRNVTFVSPSRAPSQNAYALPERFCCVSFGFWVATGLVALTQDSFG